MQARTLHISMMFVSSFLGTLAGTVSMVYQVEVVRLDALQLVLIGTTMEATVFLFEVPTGVVADLHSRRLSVLIGYLLRGAGLILMGWVPMFWAVAVSSFLAGIGHTFVSGAKEAWLVDELISEHGTDDTVGDTFLRSSQASSAGSMFAIPLGVYLGWQNLATPILIGGGGTIALAFVLVFLMRERGFRPVPPAARETWASMRATLSTAYTHVRREHYLILILGISLIYGLSSEGYDRLTAPHLLRDFDLPFPDSVKPVAWFGLISFVSELISIGMSEIARRNLDLRRGSVVSATLMLTNAGMVIAIVCLAWTDLFWAALAWIWVTSALRRTGGPLLTTWYNQQIQDPTVRATLFSVQGQADAVGQVVGGPPAGLIGRAISVGWGITASAMMLSLVIPIFGFSAIRISRRERDDDRPS
jgi:MFS transporter, DHA3 family, tetracycline resistance protein